MADVKQRVVAGERAATAHKPTPSSRNVAAVSGGGGGL